MNSILVFQLLHACGSPGLDFFLLFFFSFFTSPTDGRLDWRQMQSLVRSMPELHKTLILASVSREAGKDQFRVDELALATEHAPFRHRRVSTEVGGQRKKARTDRIVENDSEPMVEEGAN